ncbi:acetyl-CoA carboxylase biotin carboxyl carrier protein [Polynucleobacter antarcticus]|uniref:Biotin carboxyl carrier protein of acetyl-CoA carboxylase n=1 Tax=Polynucleobacter antarcticus TaxID=1743162 RepID=A0A6M9PL73_9BURK|nr:acetyl-CoA carboxylase biotin carboxyl carrier protein [Polynucleobacter antarcticus]QKM62964.1 acetyl-CoA carboxylase biotin carboxyl carrier protein [Polynucleobacter antarcticus]
MTSKKATPALKKRVTGKALVQKAKNTVQMPPEFTMKQVKEIVSLIKDAGTFTTFGYKTDEFEIEISVGAPTPTAVPAPYVAPQVATTTITAAPVNPALAPALSISASERLITSPMIGTFFRRPSPGSPPFVELGDVVTSKTDVCIVEVMKLLNTIPAECNGRITKILVEDGASISAGQALMVVDVS